MCASSLSQLQQLAQLYGIETSYYDMAGRQIQATADAMIAVLKSLGAPVATIEDVPSAYREQRQALWQQIIEPMSVVWDNEPPSIRVHLNSSTADAPLSGQLKLETSEQQSLHWRLADLPVLESAEVEGTPYVVKRLPLPQGLPRGYHRVLLELSGASLESLIVASPLKAYSPSKEAGKLWGVFVPLYALYTRKSWGSGDFSDMEALIDWVSQLGGGLVGTLPLLPSFFGSIGPSPYTPVSRLFWNEFYVDIHKVPELTKCPTAQTLLGSPQFEKEVQALRSQPLVDYDRQMSLKRRVLEELAQCLFAEESERLVALKRFAASHRAVEDYASFRATGERLGISCPEWPEPLRSGVLQTGDYPEKAKQYHLYAQWITHEQIDDLSKKANQNGPGLYLDLPLGVHPCGYDVWRERDIFAIDASAGAPPDPVFTSGQNWNFPPLQPEKIRAQGYRYVIDCLRHHLSQAGMLRIDHVMGFHRLFWIPKGMKNDQGLYVRYHPEEFYAILALESHRHKAIIVGEDLGMVPQEVRPAMAQHGLYRTYVAQYELTTEWQRALTEVPPDSVASLNTHDMFPFAAFWQELDIPERKMLGLLGEVSVQQEVEHRRRLKGALLSLLQHKGLVDETNVDIPAILRGTLDLLSRSAAQAVLINLEDLWLETRPQNIPGTHGGQNWHRRARYAFEEFSQLPQLVDVLGKVDKIRKQME